MSFFETLADRIAAVDSVVSVGLDPDPARLPEAVENRDLPRWAFNRRIIDATHEHAACYKPNAAFYEDAAGWRALRETIAYAHGKNVPVLLDAKRADIGNTARQYATAASGEIDGVDADSENGLTTRETGAEQGLGADAITVTPYMGQDSLQPFFSSGAGVFILCRTSNPGGADLQGLELASGEPVYRRVAALADLWNEHGNVGLVVGATAPEELEQLRTDVPGIPFLVPGIGAQGGDAEAAVEHGLAAYPGVDPDVGLVNSSRGIIFAGKNAADGRDGDNYFRAAGEAAKRLKRRLNQFR